MTTKALTEIEAAAIALADAAIASAKENGSSDPYGDAGDYCDAGQDICGAPDLFWFTSVAVRQIRRRAVEICNERGGF